MKIISCLLSTMLLISCNTMNTDGVLGSGKVTQKTYDLAEFKEIDLSVVFDVTIIPSDKEKVIIETDDNLQELVMVENMNNRLSIKMKPEVNITKKTMGKVTVYVKELNHIINSSVGLLENKGSLNSNKLVVNNSAVGNVNLNIKSEDCILSNSAVGNTDLNGSCNNLEIKNSAVGNLDTADLKSRTLDLHNQAVGNTVVFAYDAISIDNSAIGKLDVFGNCVIKKMTNNAVGKFVKH